MKQKKRLGPFDIYKLLPKSNCKRCGYMTCMAFAVALISREKQPRDCPELQTEPFLPVLEFLEGYFPPGDHLEKNGMIIHRDLCTGCGDCVAVCTYALSTTGKVGYLKKREPTDPVLQIVDGVVRVINAEACKRCMDEPELCTVCQSKCVFQALDLVSPPES